LFILLLLYGPRFQLPSSYIFLFSSTFLLLVSSSLQVEPGRTEIGRGREIERERLPEVERIPFLPIFLQLGRERGEEDSCWTSEEKQRTLMLCFSVAGRNYTGKKKSLFLHCLVWFLAKGTTEGRGESVYGSPTQFLLSISRSLTLSFRLPVSLGKRESKGKNGKEGEQRRKKKE
jgi:hypothetical protein